MRAAVVITLAGCYAGDYATLTTPFIGTRADVGCLDVTVALTEDNVAPGPIVAYQFGNKCFHQTLVDFTSVRVVATTHEGKQVELRAEDPRGELKPMQLDAWTAGDERIAYNGATGIDHVCVDLGRFDGNPSAPPMWKCMGASH
jgi:hypothetical protein